MSGGGFLREIQLLRESVEDFGQYPFSIPAVRHLERLPFNPGVTVIVGENGSGKSTLIEAIAIRVGLNPEGGSRNFRFAIRPSESPLHEHLRLVRGTNRERSSFFLRAETLFNVAKEVEDKDLVEDGWEDMYVRSHGEALLWIVQNRFHPRGLFLLDEPESALSPQRQLALLRLLHDRIRSGSQIVMATHSPILMAYPGATIYACTENGIRAIDYEETEHFIVTRAFLNRRDQMLADLLGETAQER